MAAGGQSLFERGHNGLFAAALLRGTVRFPRRLSRASIQPSAQRFKHPRLSLSLELFHNSGARNASVDARPSSDVVVVHENSPGSLRLRNIGDSEWKNLSTTTRTESELTRGIFAEHVSETFGDHR